MNGHRRIVTQRVVDLPKPHVRSVQATCSVCGYPVWLSRATRADMVAGDVLVCARDALELAEGDDEPPTFEIGPNTESEVRAYYREGPT